MTRVIIADDHAVVRQGLIRILADEWPTTVFSEAANVHEVLRLCRIEGPWDAAVLDLNMPGSEGVEGIKDVKRTCPRLPVLVLSVHSEDQYAVRALRAGAAGYLSKDSAPEELVQALRRVLSGGRYISPAVADILAQTLETRQDDGRPLHERLSDREFQILRAIGSGRTVTQIAAELSLSVKTVSTYRTRLLQKMDMNTSAELTTYALRHHLVD